MVGGKVGAVLNPQACNGIASQERRADYSQPQKELEDSSCKLFVNF